MRGETNRMPTLKVGAFGDLPPTTVDFKRYANGRVALQLVTETGEHAAVATIAVGELPAEGCVWLKGRKESDGLPEALVRAGVVELTGRRFTTPYVEALEARLTAAVHEALTAADV